MSWTSWFASRPSLKAEVEEASQDVDAFEGVPRPLGSFPPAAVPEHLATVVTDAVAAIATGAVDVGAELDEFSGRAAEIEASAEIVEEALAVAHTVFTEACGGSSTPCSGIGPGAAAGDLAETPTLGAADTCEALVPCPAVPDDIGTSYSCVIDMDGFEPLRRSAMRRPVGPDLPSLEELLACTHPHDILGVPKGADKEVIKKAYHNRARAFHPDKHGDDDRDIDRAFNQAFMLITRAYMMMIGGDANIDRLQILNKMDLRRDRPVVGWALQQKYDERQREKLTRAEKTLHEARKEVALAQQACARDGEPVTPKESRAQQRRLTRANLALTKAEATLQAEQSFYEIQQQKEREKVMQRLERQEKAKEAVPKKRRRDSGRREKLPPDILKEASRLELQAEEMRKKAANLRARAQGLPGGDTQDDAEAVQGARPGKRRLVIQGCGNPERSGIAASSSMGEQRGGS